MKNGAACYSRRVHKDESMSIRLHIGLDDTDSPSGGCTTYIGAVLVEKLSEIGCSFLDYPNLIRLNPNIPWKTRGNGAVCLRVLCPISEQSLVEKISIETLRRFSMSEINTDPAVAILEGDVPEDLEEFSKHVITDVATTAEAMKFIKDYCIRYKTLSGDRGIIGALAAIGALLKQDHTYELIAYRLSISRTKKRGVDPDSVRVMDAATRPSTFSNIDYETGRILITPRGTDPIIYGIRGETPYAVLDAHRMIKAYDQVERWVIFRTNHGTDSHLTPVPDLSHVKPHCPIIVTGVVSSQPRTIAGGHVIFSLSDQTGKVDCAAYEPTGGFRDKVRELIVGDVVQVFGGVRPASNSFRNTVNLEKIRILKLAQKVIHMNPRCPQCAAKMESEGRFQGFRCAKCGIEDFNVPKCKVAVIRHLEETLYLPPVRAHRHLTKPLARYGVEKKDGNILLIEEWNSLIAHQFGSENTASKCKN